MSERSARERYPTGEDAKAVVLGALFEMNHSQQLYTSSVGSTDSLNGIPK
jgi:hypothetical protein